MQGAGALPGVSPRQKMQEEMQARLASLTMMREERRIARELMGSPEHYANVRREAALRYQIAREEQRMQRVQRRAELQARFGPVIGGAVAFGERMDETVGKINKVTSGLALMGEVGLVAITGFLAATGGPQLDTLWHQVTMLSGEIGIDFTKAVVEAAGALKKVRDWIKELDPVLAQNIASWIFWGAAATAALGIGTKIFMIWKPVGIVIAAVALGVWNFGKGLIFLSAKAAIATGYMASLGFAARTVVTTLLRFAPIILGITAVVGVLTNGFGLFGDKADQVAQQMERLQRSQDFLRRVGRTGGPSPLVTQQDIEEQLAPYPALRRQLAGLSTEDRMLIAQREIQTRMQQMRQAVTTPGVGGLFGVVIPPPRTIEEMQERARDRMLAIEEALQAHEGRPWIETRGTNRAMAIHRALGVAPGQAPPRWLQTQTYSENLRGANLGTQKIQELARRYSGFAQLETLLAEVRALEPIAGGPLAGQPRYILRPTARGLAGLVGQAAFPGMGVGPLPAMAAMGPGQQQAEWMESVRQRRNEIAMALNFRSMQIPVESLHDVIQREAVRDQAQQERFELGLRALDKLIQEVINVNGSVSGLGGLLNFAFGGNPD
jgi:hypothetical protein